MDLTSVKNYIAKGSPSTDVDGDPTEQFILLRDLIAKQPLGHLLEIGCGNGRNLACLSDLFPQLRLTGVELHEGDAAIARRSLGKRGEVLVCNGQRMPFDSGTFDFVIIPHVIEHVKEPASVLAEARRVLKPGGALQVNTPNWMRTWNRLFRILPGMQPRLRWPRRMNESAEEFRGHLHEFTLRELSELVTKCGFQEISTRVFHPKLILRGSPAWIAFNTTKFILSRSFGLLGQTAGDNLAILAVRN